MPHVQRKDTSQPHHGVLKPSLSSLLPAGSPQFRGRIAIRLGLTKPTASITLQRNNSTRALPSPETTAFRFAIHITSANSSDELCPRSRLRRCLGSSHPTGPGIAIESTASVTLHGNDGAGAFTSVETAAFGLAVGVGGAGAGDELGALGGGEEGDWEKKDG
jgi:hypothetical protein